MPDIEWKSLICIDDSGTPGTEAASKHLHKDRKTWVAIFFDEEDVAFLSKGYPSILNAVKDRFGSEELHFTDIYSGKREWKDVTLDDRMFIFKTFAEVFAIQQFELIVQTISPDHLSEHPQIKERSAGPFDYSKPDEAALAFLLARISRFCKDHQDDYEQPTRIVVDNGWKKAGYILPLPGFSQAGGQIEFQDSRSFPALQFADFAAFSLNRSQWIAAKDDKSDLDKHMLTLFSKANFNFVNIPKEEFDANGFSREDFERIHEKYREEKGLKPRPWEKKST